MKINEVIEILNGGFDYYDTLQEQLTALEQKCEIEREKLYFKNISYDATRVVSSHEPDKNLADMVDKINKIIEKNKANIELLEKKSILAQLVYNTISKIPVEYQMILYKLYYPRKSISDVSNEMKLGRVTLIRKRDKAIELLGKKLKYI